MRKGFSPHAQWPAREIHSTSCFIWTSSPLEHPPADKQCAGFLIGFGAARRPWPRISPCSNRCFRVSRPRNTTGSRNDPRSLERYLQCRRVPCMPVTPGLPRHRAADLTRGLAGAGDGALGWPSTRTSCWKSVGVLISNHLYRPQSVSLQRLWSKRHPPTEKKPPGWIARGRQDQGAAKMRFYDLSGVASGGRGQQRGPCRLLLFPRRPADGGGRWDGGTFTVDCLLRLPCRPHRQLSAGGPSGWATLPLPFRKE